ncbi:hypothetical protein Bho11B_001060 [Bartonella sp. 11B]|nr:hypothetical protein Bho11B_001060 [Bartonella sp. 11B]AQX24583.1 hypothetical protein Bho114_012730 [Bartonella sp. 114]
MNDKLFKATIKSLILKYERVLKEIKSFLLVERRLTGSFVYVLVRSFKDPDKHIFCFIPVEKIPLYCF